MGFDDIPPELAGLSQFCLRVGKRPFIRDMSNGGFTPKWTDPAGWMKLDEALAELERNKSSFDGVGYLNTKALDDSRQITGGDLDACRDPITGWVSPWALELLEQTKPFYCEISPSGCGLRFFYLARLPNRVDSLFGNGPQELPDEVKEHIMAAKPAIKEKIDKGETAFNSIELYENKRHLTLTGNTFKDFCYPIEDKTEAMAEALALAGIVTPEKPKATLQATEIEQIKQTMKRRGLTDEQINAFLESKGMNPVRAEGCQGAGGRSGSDEMPGWVNEMSEEANKNRLPSLNILDVIDTQGWEISGAQLRGPHPILGSTTGHNLVVNPEAGLWAYMHNNINSGGDSWIWLACECGAVKWEEAGAGALKDPAIIARTVAYAKSKKLIPDDALPPHIAGITLDSEAGSIGMLDAPGHKYNGAICQMQTVESKVKGTSIEPVFISDCAVYIHTETTEDGKTEFQLKGKGRKDGREVSFSATPEMLTDPRKFHSLLMHQFGGFNRVFKLNIDMLQQVSRDILKKERVTIPRWRDNIPLVPGLDLTTDVEFKLSSKIPAEVHGGDLQAAKEVLNNLLNAHKYAPILAAVILGSPAIARWHKKDRFGLGLWAETGTFKTSMILACMGVYGIGYLDEPKLKAGQHGSTVVGAMEIFAAAGFLPQLYDNVKTVNQKDVESYVGMVHAVLEGGEKARGKKDGGLRESRDFSCIPIITGEVRPGEAATSARVLNLNWTRANAELLAEVQANADVLPVIGYHWLRFLADTGFVLGKDFEAFRTAKMNEFLRLHYVNPGRLATIYALLISIWQLLEESPLGDVIREHTERFKAALDEAIMRQGQTVSDETEVSKFMGALEELLAANPGLLQSIDGEKTITGAVIGKSMEAGIFLLPTETLNEMAKIRVFTQQPTVDSLTQALNEKGYLIPDTDGKHLKYRCRLNGGNPRGWYIKAEVFPTESGVFPPTGNAKTNINKAFVPTFPLFPEKKKERFSEENLGQFLKSNCLKDKNDGNNGNSGNIDSIDRLVDSDLDSKVSVPNSVPTVPTCIASFRTDYRTDLNSTMHDFKEGDQIEVARWRAEAWQKRGIVDIVEASL